LNVAEKTLSQFILKVRSNELKEQQLTIHISDMADEFRIEIIGPFTTTAVRRAAEAWQAALLTKAPRRFSVDITQMTGYNHAGYLLLREMHAHGTHIVAGTAKSLSFFNQISGPAKLFVDLLDPVSDDKTTSSRGRVVVMRPRPLASGE